MKTASLVLGIIGGVLAVIFAVVFIIGGALVSSMESGMDALASQMAAEGWEVTDNSNASNVVSAAAGAAAGTLWLIGIASIVGAVLGIVGGVFARKKNILAGIFMVVAAIPSIFTGLGLIASVLFVVGGILAFIPEKTSQKVTA